MCFLNLSVFLAINIKTGKNHGWFYIEICHVLHDVLSADRLHVLMYEVGNKRGSTWSISV